VSALASCDLIAADRPGSQRHGLRDAVMLGLGLVTPRRRLTIDGEVLLPDKDRLAPDHPWVRRNPQDFAPCRSDDAATVARHRSALLEQRRGAVTRADAPAWPLEQSGADSFRLPPSVPSSTLRLP
jgi:hypothetical protein